MHPTRAACLATALVACLAARGAADPPEVKLSGDEQKIVKLTNAARQKKGLPPLTVNPVLCRVAHGHSENMAKQGKVEHVLDGKGPFDRMRSGGYEYQVAGENLGYANFPIDELFQEWLKSQSHRENILEPDYTEMGVAQVTNSEGVSYYTHVFGKPLPQPGPRE